MCVSRIHMLKFNDFKMIAVVFNALFHVSKNIGTNIFVTECANNILLTALDTLIDIFFTNKKRPMITPPIIPKPIMSHFYAVLVPIIVIRIAAVPICESYWISIPAPNKMSLILSIVSTNPYCTTPNTAVI